MQKALATILVILGVVLIFKTLAATWLLLIVIAAGLAIAASGGAIGRWGYAAAGVLALLAIPGFFARALFVSFAMVWKFLPIILVLVGIIWLIKPKRR